MKPITAVCTVMLIAAPAIGSAQDRYHPDFGSIVETAGPATENGPVLVDRPNATRTGPVTPSSRMNAPFPPPKVGCHHLESGKWQEVPCLSDEDIRKHHIPPPLGNAIQSTPHGFVMIANHVYRLTSHFVWGSVAFNFISDSSQATETDGTQNAFSIQNNTNTFNCTTCSSGNPFATIQFANPQISQSSASQPGDQSWVQFTYQEPQPGAEGFLCVWNVDATIASNTNNAQFPNSVNGGYANDGFAGYNATCMSPTGGNVQTLTGFGSNNDGAEVIGYIQCPNANSNAGCTLWNFAYLPWVGGWWAISAADGLGLSGNWTEVSGSLLGSGNGSGASFTKTQIYQVLRAYSCVVAPQDATGFTPQPCSPPAGPFDIALLSHIELSATPTIVSGFQTQESNNLTNGPVTFVCEAFDCWLSYNSSSPDCTTLGCR
jgi:hypothetical protein